MAFKKGDKKPENSGKQKGSQNKVTGKAKELLVMAIDSQSVHFDEVMLKLKEDEPREWAKIMIQLFKFVAPEKLDITSDNKGMSIPVMTWAKPKQNGD